MDDGKLTGQRKELASAPELWQFDLLNPQQFCQFAMDRAIPIFKFTSRDVVYDGMPGSARSGAVGEAKR